MTTCIDEKALRRRILATFHQDGLAEMIFGAWFLSVATSIILDGLFGFTLFYVLSIGPLAVLSSLYPRLKYRMMARRTGYVRFPAQKVRRASTWSFLLGTFAFLGFMILFMFSDRFGDTAGHLFIFTLPLAMTAVAFATGGYKLSNPRWLFYCAVYAVSWVLGLLVLEPGWIMHASGFTVAGAVPVLGGLVAMIRFFRNHRIGETAVQT
jgi:hypothetical protein